MPSELILADQYEAEPGQSALCSSNDLAPFKPSTDITAIGKIRRPDGKAQPYFDASIEVGACKKTLRATGPRFWKASTLGWKLTAPEDTEAVPCSYRLAAGGRIIGDPDGAVDLNNPSGPGVIHPKYTPKDRTYPAPQIESARWPISTDFKNPPLPEGFGPMAPAWGARLPFAGTYDDSWLKNAHPRLPSDFDYRFWQVAHPDLICKSYLKGNEAISIHGFGAPIVSSLPGLCCIGLWHFRDGRCVEVLLNLDGVHFELEDSPIMHLTWRGWVEICPSFQCIDLEYGPIEKLNSEGLVISYEGGVREVAL